MLRVRGARRRRAEKGRIDEFVRRKRAPGPHPPHNVGNATLVAQGRRCVFGSPRLARATTCYGFEAVTVIAVLTNRGEHC